ncbi:uncharacterized protein [Apostichopus japonicus]|uniref:uncharacterized protein isoform X2 n=1 Tax=Stichopus japonicus TaxID=307972 RepID=UPI003AB4F92F
MRQLRELCFMYGVFSQIIFVRCYVARDLSCPEDNQHSLPRSDDRPFIIYLSIEDSYHLNVDPICRLAVRVPQVINMYQVMRLAQYQHGTRFNFSARSDDQLGFVMQSINGKWARTRIIDWLLFDVNTGNQITKSITEVFMEDRKSYSWVYTRSSNNMDTYTGGCGSGSRSNYIRPSSQPIQQTMLYLSVQFWSDVWPLCKIPVLVLDQSRVNLNDLMLEAKRQYKHLFVYQKYDNYQIYDINDLHSNGVYFWKAEIADSNAELDKTLYLVPLEDGQHVIWRFINDEGEPRYKTLEPGVTVKVTPAVVESENTVGAPNAETHTGSDSTNLSSVVRATLLPWLVMSCLGFLLSL